MRITNIYARLPYAIIVPRFKGKPCNGTIWALRVAVLSPTGFWAVNDAQNDNGRAA